MARVSSILKSSIKVLILLAGLFGIYYLISGVTAKVSHSVQMTQDASANGSIVKYSVSAEPFGPAVATVQSGQQYFFNMSIKRTEGRVCYVKTSWRWVLHLPTGDSVMWNSSDGEFYVGDKNENLSQSFTAPEHLIPGSYTVTRLASFKCGDMEQYGKAVRSFDLIVVK